MLTTALAGVGAILGTTIGSAQDPADPNWNCRASVLRVEEGAGLLGIGGKPAPVEPVIANGQPKYGAEADNASCVDDKAALPSVDLLDPVVIAADLLAAETKVTPSASAPSKERVNTATTSAEKIALLTPVPGNLITLDSVQSTATAKCVNGVPDLTGSSQLVNLRIAGQAVPVDDVVGQLSEALNPLDDIIDIRVNEQVKSNVNGVPTLTQTALKIRVLSVAGPEPLATIVLGETKVSAAGDVCSDPPPPPTVTTTETIKESVPGPTTTETTTQTVPGPTVTQTQTQTVPGPTRTVQAPPTVVKQTVAVQPNGVPASNCARLSMYFQTNRKKTLSVKFGRERVVTRGRLVTCGGKSIRGARIDVIHVLPSGERRLVKTGMRTRELGRATLILPKNLFTRKIEFRYRPNLASTRVASRQTLSLRVRSKTGKLVTKAPPGQGTVKF